MRISEARRRVSVVVLSALLRMSGSGPRHGKPTTVPGAGDIEFGFFGVDIYLIVGS